MKENYILGIKCWHWTVVLLSFLSFIGHFGVNAIKLFKSSPAWAVSMVAFERPPTPSPAWVGSPSSKAAIIPPPTAAAEFLGVHHFIFWHFTMHYQHFGFVPRPWNIFRGRWLRLSKRVKKKKKERKGAFFPAGRSSDMIVGFFLLLLLFINLNG